MKVRKGLGGVYTAKAEHKDCRLFKTLMDNRCSHDCRYCGNSSSCTRKREHASYEPRELADVFSYMRRELDVHGMFLSSAVCGDPDVVTERMLEAVRIIRHEQGFAGYVHFKVLPGTSRELISQAAELSDRMSINIEAPNGSVMGEMSGTKEYGTDIVRRQRWVSAHRLPSGQTTQMIVSGMATDREILRSASWEYAEMGLRRVYFSAFRPLQGTPMGTERGESALRQNRLYNADFLMRDYGYSLKELFCAMDGGMLSGGDPKVEIAKATMDGPLDIEGASYEQLIRIPGIGPATARDILAKKGRIRTWRELGTLGGWTKRARPFLKVGGKWQSTHLWNWIVKAMVR